MIRNPYDSPRVLKAVLEEVIEMISVECAQFQLSSDYAAKLQKYADAFCSLVKWKGVTLNKLISIDCYPDITTLTDAVFRLRPLSEDGRWLLKNMGLVQETKPLPKVVEKPKINITRIVEL